MAANVSFNPYLTTNAAGLFGVQSDGYIQGMAMDDPAIRNLLSGGVLASTETLPMWGGCAIQELVPFNSDTSGLGPTIARSTLMTNLTGFSVLNQAHHMITSVQSEAPSSAAGMGVHFYRLGSNARVPVACAPSLVALDGGLTTQQVSWDFNAQQLVPYQPATGQLNVSSMSWANTNGGTVSLTTSAAHNLVAGDYFTIANAVPAAYNGDWVVVTAPTTTTLTFALPAGTTPGTVTTQGVVLAGGGALPVRVLNVAVGNSKTFTYDAVNNYVHWSNTGTCALILL